MRYPASILPMLAVLFLGAHTTRIYSQYIGMEFGIEKYTMLIMRSGKQQMTERIKLPYEGKIRRSRVKENYMYLEILEAYTINETEIQTKK